MNRHSSNAMVLARILIAIVFLLNATGVVDQTEAARELAARGTPSNLVPFLMFVARSVELIAGLALIFGIVPRLAALALCGFLVAATYVGHAFWLVEGTPAYMGQLINFSKNVAIMGGLLFLASVKDQPGFRWGLQGKTSQNEVFSNTENARP